jgi:glc operon protein GlcG
MSQLTGRRRVGRRTVRPPESWSPSEPCAPSAVEDDVAVVGRTIGLVASAGRERNKTVAMISTLSLGYLDARRAIERAIAECEARRSSAVIAVADANGELLALVRMDGAPTNSVRIATHKAFTAAQTKAPSKQLGAAARHPEHGFDLGYFGDPRYIGWGGGVPVFADGACVGSVALSGLPEADDIEIAELVVAELETSITQ